MSESAKTGELSSSPKGSNDSDVCLLPDNGKNVEFDIESKIEKPDTEKIEEIDIERIDEEEPDNDNIEDPDNDNIEDPGNENIEDPDNENIEDPDNEKTVEESPVDDEPDDGPKCVKCKKRFRRSWLFNNFRYKCCDECRDRKGEHKLITKTRALGEYLLKDFHLDKMENPLRYVEARNPHKRSWAPMKLCLRVQVEELALDVWGSKEKMEIERQNRKEKKALAKAKKLQSQLGQESETRTFGMNSTSSDDSF